VCVYIYMHVYTFVYIYIHVYICKYVYTHTRTHTHAHTHTQGGWWPCAERDEDFETYVWQLCPASCNKCQGGGPYTAPDIEFDGVAAPSKFVMGPVVLLRDAGGSKDGGGGDMLVVLHESPAPVGHLRALPRYLQLVLKLEGVDGWMHAYMQTPIHANTHTYIHKYICTYRHDTQDPRRWATRMT